MDPNRKVAFFLCLGAVGGAGIIFTVAYLRKLLRKACTRASVEQLTHAISLPTLKKLSQVSNVSIRLCIQDMTMDRAIRPQSLQFIIYWCYADDEDSVLKACTVIEVLAKNSRFKAKLINFGGLEALCHAIYRSWAKKSHTHIFHDSLVQNRACTAIFNLIHASEDGEQTDARKSRLVDKNPSFIPALLGIVKETCDGEAEKLCFMLIHTIAVCDCTREKLRNHWQIVEVTSQFLVKNQGDGHCMRLALHVLVTLANVLMANEEEKVLQEIGEFGVVRPAIACFKSESSEVVYWAVGLIHEFVVNNIAMEEICSVPILLKSLYRVLVSSEANLQRLVLRILRYLSEYSEKFKTSVIHHKQLLARLPICLASGDEDLVSWSLFLIHDIAKTGDEAVEQLFQHSKGLIQALVPLSLINVNAQPGNTKCRYIAETLGFFCSVETIQCDVVKAGALKAVFAFAIMLDMDMKYWSTSLLLNLSMSADVFKEAIIEVGGVRVLINIAVCDMDDPRVAMQAAKTLIMLGFIDTPFCVDLKSSGYKSSCSILVDGIEYSPNGLGINMVIVDPSTLKVVKTATFDTGHDVFASSRLTHYINTLPMTSLVFAVVRGEANFFLKDDAKQALAHLGLTGYDYHTGQLWVLSGQKGYGKDIPGKVEFKHGYESVELRVETTQGYYVNNQVEMLIIVPLLDILISTPPESNISKVSELELFSILARHDSHRKVMLRKPGFLEYIAKVIWSMASTSLNDLRSNTMLFAHCIGAMKIVSGLILSESAAARCFQSGVIKEVIRLLFFINDVILQGQKEQREITVKVKTDGEVGLSSLMESSLGMEEKVPFSSVSDSTATQHGNVSLDESFREDITRNYEDFEDVFRSLTQLSVTILYHCSKLHLENGSIYTALSVHVVWCTLLTCKDTLIRAIAIPIENIITSCSHLRKPLVIHPERSPICLDHKEMTKALMLSSDRLEVINFNWTFESVHATRPVCRRRHIYGPIPAGWYYEVQIKTQGIMQIGWRTSECRYDPEKGAGVGDDVHSCAFDGARMKIWGSPAFRHVNNDYGKEWAVDDIVSCLFSWNGEVSFWLNGENLGVAFTGMNPNLEHYPAASLAMDQHCCFNFGEDKPFRYAMPKGYVGVNDIVGKNLYSSRPRSRSYTKGSFESIAEEDEEGSEEVDNTHPSKLHRSCSSEPSLRKKECMKPSQSLSLLVERRRQSSNTLCYDAESPRAPTPGPSTPSTPFTPVTPLSPFSLPGFEQMSPDVYLSIPCMYFEAEVNESACRARNVGFFNVKTGDSTSCEFYEAQNFTFPSQAATNAVRAPFVIGCGMRWPDGIFFTLDGVFNNDMFRLPGKDVEEGYVLPFVTCPQLKVNYGQEEFLFKQGNFEEERLAAAELLHSFCRRLLEKLT